MSYKVLHVVRVSGGPGGGGGGGGGIHPSYTLTYYACRVLQGNLDYDNVMQFVQQCSHPATLPIKTVRPV